jgi:hypothetical protein
MSFNRLAQIATVVSVVVFVSTAALPAFAQVRGSNGNGNGNGGGATIGNCGNGVGNGNASCGTATGSVAPLPALGTGLPGLIVLAGGLVAFARRRRR